MLGPRQRMAYTHRPAERMDWYARVIPRFRAMHYPRRLSKLSRARKMGFRARMRTKGGRKIINRRRRIGRAINFKK